MLVLNASVGVGVPLGGSGWQALGLSFGGGLYRIERIFAMASRFGQRDLCLPGELLSVQIRIQWFGQMSVKN